MAIMLLPFDWNPQLLPMKILPNPVASLPEDVPRVMALVKDEELPENLPMKMPLLLV
jgi:hypothetical protein